MENCIFCKIARQEIPAKLVYEDDTIVAFHDVNPGAPVHILVIPRKHIPGIMALSDDTDLIGNIMMVVKKLAQETGIAESGFRVVVNSGEDAGQSVPHIHFHLLGGRHLKWPPG